MWILYLYFVCALGESVFADLTVQITNGKIEGYVRTTPNNVTFHAFQGIPYAEPPLGSLRFQAPVPVANWSDTLETKKDSSRCFSVAKDTGDEDEDCLSINVYTPVLNTTGSPLLPVMVYLYGGGFRDGASQYNFYGPDYLIEKDVLMVSLNYRVGPFGFLSTGDEVVPGNAGLKDQLLGLKWVQSNIEKFGGDPKKVTIFGQSAGGASVGLHILSERSAGLFRAAIAESGAGISNWAYLKDPAPYGYDLASLINSSAILNTSSELLEYLQSVPAIEIDVASTKTKINHPLPVVEVEHDGAFMTKNFLEVLENGEINRVPLFIGFNSEEYISLFKDLKDLSKRGAAFDNDLKKLVPGTLNIVDKTKKLEIAQKIKEIYIKPNETFQENLGLTIAYKSESHYMNPVVKHAELQSKYTDVFLYKFSHAGPMGKNYNSTLTDAEKCTHGEEMFYIFRRILPGYDNSDLSQFPAADVLTHERMITLWTNFAKYLNPTPIEDTLLQNLTWPKLTTSNFRYLNIDTNLSIETDLKQGRYRKWMELFEKEALPPYVAV